MTVDAGTNTENDLPCAGWGMVVVNSEGGFTHNPAATDETIGMIIRSIVNGGGIIYTGGTLTIECETDSYSDYNVLSFVGALGEEIILFRGLETEIGSAQKSYHLDQNRARKVLKAYKRTNKTLRTVYETVGVRRLLFELIYTEQDVWLYATDVTAGYRQVTVVSDEATISDQRELIEGEIDIEYHE